MKASIGGVRELMQAAAWVRNIPEQATRAAVSAINRTAVQMSAVATQEMQGRVNLPVSYIRGKLRTVRATAGDPVGRITIWRRAVRLARFDAQQLSVAAPRAKGDRSRGIAKGFKQAGVSVKVRHARKSSRSAFMMKLKNGNGLGVFLRTGSEPKDVQHLYGPSPDQLFRAWRDDNLHRVQQHLVENFGEELRRTLRNTR